MPVMFTCMNATYQACPEATSALGKTFSNFLGSLYSEKGSGVQVGEAERKDLLASTMGMGHLLLIFTSGLNLWLEWLKLKEFWLNRKKDSKKAD